MPDLNTKVAVPYPYEERTSGKCQWHSGFQQVKTGGRTVQRKDTALTKAQEKGITGHVVSRSIRRVCVGGEGGMRFKK